MSFENDFEYEDVKDVDVLRKPDLNFEYHANHIPGPIALFTNFFVLTSHRSIILKKKIIKPLMFHIQGNVGIELDLKILQLSIGSERLARTLGVPTWYESKSCLTISESNDLT